MRLQVVQLRAAINLNAVLSQPPRPVRIAVLLGFFISTPDRVLVQALLNWADERRRSRLRLGA